MDAETITGAFIGFAIVMGWGYYAHYSDKKKADDIRDVVAASRAAREAREERTELKKTAKKLWEEGRYEECLEVQKKRLAMWEEYERSNAERGDDSQANLAGEVVSEIQVEISKLEAEISDAKSSE